MAKKTDKIVVLEQAPIITYAMIEKASAEVAAKISSLNIDAMEATEENLKLIKDTRAELNNEFKVFEDQRKLVKDYIMKPYEQFESLYKPKIVTLFNDAENKLKSKVGSIESGLLNLKIENLKSIFNELNTYEFIKFEDVGLHITRSASDTKLQGEIEQYLESVSAALSTIDVMPNSDRILAKYHLCKDLPRAISEVNIELQKEAELQQKKQAVAPAEPVAQAERVRAKTKPEPTQRVRTSFRVTATLDQIADLKQFMNERGISYESIR